MTDIRNLVLDILIENESRGVFLSDIITAVQEKYAYLEERDRALIKNLATGTVEKKIALDYVIDSVSSVKTARMKNIVRHIIRMAAFEIIYLDHIPPRASVNEAVRLTRKRHIAGLSGFVNAVLRKISVLHDEQRIDFPNDRIRYSFPEYIFDILVLDLGEETALRIMKSSLEKRPLYLRVNSALCSKNELSDILQKEGVSVREVPGAESALASEGFNVGSSGAFRKGLFSIQDISSMAALESAGISEGMEIIDLCAAPGGKTCYAAELMKGTGKVRAFDISPEKVEKIDDNAKRLGLKNVSAAIGDASEYDEKLKEKADMVIADLPCSGLGVMNRKVDIKYRIGREDIDSLVTLQRKILDNACRYVKEGGKLLYSTCTLTARENKDQADYIEKNTGFVKIKERQFIQGVDDCDGFYYALFERSAAK